MSNEQANTTTPDPDKPGHDILIVEGDNCLRASEDYRGRGRYGYGGSLDNVTKPTEQELYQMFDEERELRKKLRAISFQGKRTLQEIGKIFRENSHGADLLEWARIHRRNRMAMMKLSQDIMIVPQTQFLLKIADFLKKEE